MVSPAANRAPSMLVGTGAGGCRARDLSLPLLHTLDAILEDRWSRAPRRLEESDRPVTATAGRYQGVSRGMQQHSHVGEH